MNESQDNIIDLMTLINSSLGKKSLIDNIKYCDIVLLLSSKRVTEDTFATYKSLLEQIGTVMLPFFQSTGKDFSPNLFGADLSKMELSHLEPFVSKRLSFYDINMIEDIESLLNKEETE
jgi:hypothetical protein